MRALLTIASCLPVYGGPAFMVAKLAAALADEGIEVFLWAADGSAQQTPLLEVGPLIKVLGGKPEEAFDIAKADILHDHGVWRHHNHVLARLARSSETPRIVSTHGMLDPWCLAHKRYRKRVAWLLYQRHDLRSAQRLHVTSVAEVRNLEQLSLGVPISLLPIGVEVPKRQVRDVRRLKEPNDKKVAVYLGRIHPVKGLPMLIEAWDHVKPPGWTLKIAGPDCGGHRRQLEDMVNSRQLSAGVSFNQALTGRAKERFLAGADLFILPSHSESFGVAVAEALGHRLPVLTTTAAPWSILETYDCGWWVDPSPHGIMEALRHATAKTPESLTAMGDRGRNWVEANLGWKHIAGRYEALYYEALGQGAVFGAERRQDNGSATKG